MARAMHWTAWLTFGALMTIMGIVWAQAQWQTAVNYCIDTNESRIEINRQKYDELSTRASELQAVYYEQQNRIETLEARVDTLYRRSAQSADILEALYEYQTGHAWED